MDTSSWPYIELSVCHIKIKPPAFSFPFSMTFGSNWKSFLCCPIPKEISFGDDGTPLKGQDRRYFKERENDVRLMAREKKQCQKPAAPIRFCIRLISFHCHKAAIKKRIFFFVEELASKKRQFTFFVTHCNLSIWKFFLKSHAVDILNAISPIIESTTTRRRWSQKITPLFY